MQHRKIRRGDIYCADLSPVVGSEQGNKRPVLVVQNNMGNEHSPTIVISPITSNLQKNRLPTHVYIPHLCGLESDSIALIEQIRAIDRMRIHEYIGRVGNELIHNIDKALAVCVGIELKRLPKGEMLVLTLCKRCEDNFIQSGYMPVKKGWQAYKETCDYCKKGKGFTYGIFGLNGGSD